MCLCGNKSNKLLIGKILLDNQSQEIKYELVCFHCGKYGHLGDNYAWKVVEVRQGEDQLMKETVTNFPKTSEVAPMQHIVTCVTTDNDPKVTTLYKKCRKKNMT